MSRLFLVGLSLLVGLTAGAEGASQTVAANTQGGNMKPGEASALLRPARLSVSAMPLSLAMHELAERSEVSIAFSPSRLASAGKVDCYCADLTVGEALQRILSGTEFEYLELGNQIVIAERSARRTLETVKRPTVQLAEWSGSLPAILSGSLSLNGSPVARVERLQETGVITGRVTEAGSGRPLSGVQVAVDGTRLGTLTNEEGRYLLQGVPAGEHGVRVILLGFREQSSSVTVQVGATVVLNFMLPQSAIALDELVVTVTGEQRRREIGNSVGIVDAAAVTQVATISGVQELLTGRVPGVVMLHGDGQAGSGPRVTIRGFSSLNLGTEPLIYIDGIRVDNATERGPFGGSVKFGNRLSDLNPNDIERVEVVKGPAAATLYGTEASNGVIHVITKKGAPGATRFGIRVRQGAAWVPNIEGRWPVNYGLDAATGQVVSLNYAQMEKDAGNPFYRSGRLQGYGLNASGGSDVLHHYTSVDYDQDEGVERDNQFSRFSGRTNLTALPHEKVELRATFGTVVTRADFAHFIARPTGNGLDANPARLSMPSRGYSFGPPHLIKQGMSMWEDVDRFTTGLEVRHRPTQWFSHRLNVGLDFVSNEASWLVPNLEGNPAAPFISFWAAGLRYIERWADTYGTFDYSASVSTDVTQTLGSSTSAGLQFNSKKVNYIRTVSRGFPPGGVQSAASGAVKDIQEQSVTENNTVGLFLQQQFSLRDRLFVTGAVRADDNSAFGSGFDVVLYPKASVSWVVSQEPFWPFGSLETLRLRAALGSSGRQPDAFTALRTYEPVSGTSGRATVTPLSPGNPDLKPERGVELELGFEAGLFGDRLGLDFTFYDTEVRDAIVAAPSAPSFGFPGQRLVNAGELRNRGFELAVRGVLVDLGSVRWEATANVARNDSKVLSLIDDLDFLSVGMLSAHKVGYPVQGWFLKRVVSAELDGSGRATSILCDDGRGGGVGCAQAPRVYWGTPIPRTHGAFSTTATLLGWLQLYGMVDFHTGHKRQSSIAFNRCAFAKVCEENFYPERFDANRIAEFQMADFGIQGQGVVDASFAKLRELSLVVTIPDRWVRSVQASRATLRLAGRNLHTWTSFPHFDPELFDQQGFGRANPATYGAGSQTPPARQFVTTIEIAF
jgi:TonB-dependent SusC/RagA subfamily outer membrane receptor